MLRSSVYQLPFYSNYQPLSVCQKPFLLSTNAEALVPDRQRDMVRPKAPRLHFASSNTIKDSVATPAEKPVYAKVVITVKRPVCIGIGRGGLLFPDFGLKRKLDDITTDLKGKTLLLELVGAEIDPRTGMEKGTLKGYAQKVDRNSDEITILYQAQFVIPADFGPIGGVLVQNNHNREVFLKDVVIHGFPTAPLRFSCNSWIHSKFHTDHHRIFFTTKSYLPSETPQGLKRFRVEELRNLQGNGQRKCETHNRVYDYDVYNDLGDPDKGQEHKRPVLGGRHHPYPRRCRTGRARCQADPLSEIRSSNIYVPRDEAFIGTKQLTLLTKTVYWMLHGLVPALEKIVKDKESRFSYFSTTDDLFNNGIVLPPSGGPWKLNTLLPWLINAIVYKAVNILALASSKTFEKDKYFWFRDEEFARQTLAGANPCSIRLVSEWPLKSKLDPTIYGPSASAITTEIVEQQIKGLMTLDEAVEQKKLYILDYHDLFLPYVVKVRKLKGNTLYGSRTLFYLNEDNTLRPLAIELTRPPIDDKPQWKDVFTPWSDATGLWLWRIAKAHVLAHDTGYHQLVSHWLRTHCSVEPYIIATHRQLSAMHPIYKLLHPHFRYTMEINAFARDGLINVGGIIETAFSPGKYSMEFSSLVYEKQWQFNLEALPADLIHRGLATEDPSAPHGLKLAIEDYPYANDGLILWDAIKEWATDYVNYYYSDIGLVTADDELQAWWTEIRTVGHGDKKDEPWWPVLNTPQDLIDVVTTIMWVTSGHHAVVNFGQYSFTTCFPSRPTITKVNVPTEEPDSKLWTYFLEKPENVFLDTFPSQIQATIISSVMNILSSHSKEEEYMGEAMEPAWADEPVIKEAFDKFSGKLKELGVIIDGRNENPKLKNRHGAGIEPYQLLKPYSEPGVTGMGVPYSISV